MTASENGTSIAPSKESLGKLRTVDPLVIEALEGKFVISSPRNRLRLRVRADIVGLLLGARDGLDGNWPDGTPEAAVKCLADYGFLVLENQEPPTPWADWGTTAWSFHNRIRDTDFIDGSEEAAQRYVEKLSARPRPSSVRRPPSERILLLPRIRVRCEAPYLDVLESRRTHRHFDDTPVDLDRFSDMLHYSFAPLRFADAGPLGTLQLRAAASGGARHECEAFVFVFNVSGVEPGLYMYDGIRHGLVPVDENAGREQAEYLTHHQGFFVSCSFGVFTAAVAERMSWKYPDPRAYKIMLHNVGHMAQVFSMTASALGLGAALTGAIRDSDADSLLQLDEPREFTTFAMACGIPSPGPDGLPQSIKTPRTPPEAY
ncbi:SagB/ThcOx family dehydrogenase [Streptomyces sp. NPDC001480]|uniref:SagB/ThcOx family dehydrogenase n=1 Tax=Streptomyces sp. NPDC001480 TaxID=3364577 RepID=UPI00368D2D02